MSNAVMSGNIVDLVKDQIGDQLLGQVKGLLGDEGPKASTALGSALPAMLSGVTNLAGSAQGAETLFNTVNNQDDGLLDNIGSMLREGQSSSVVDQGGSLLGTLFGNGGADSLGSVLSSFTGLSRGGTSSLMGIIAPIVLGVIKRKFMGGITNPGGLASLLKDQQPNINAAMPSGLTEKLQSSGFLSSVASASSGATAPRAAANNVQQSTSQAPKSGGSSITKYLLPLVGLLALAWLGMKFLGGGSAPDVADTASDAATATTEAVESAADVDVGAIGTELTGVFGSATDALSGVTDAASAEAAIPALEGVGSSLGNVSGLIEKVPEAARGPLTSIVSEGMGSLQPIIDKVIAIPGVGPILEPVINPILETLQGLAG